MAKDAHPGYCAEHSAALATLAEQIAGDRAERAQFRATLATDIQALTTQVKETNGRVRKLEQWKTFLLGGFAALSMPAAAKLVEILSP